MRNPEQLRKTLRSPKTLDYPITFMCYETTPFPTLRRIMDKIIAGFGPQASIMLLGRTNYDLELVAESGLFQVGKNGSLKYLASPETPISFMTVHKSKGLEADNVVLLNFQNATLGFPNKIADDPILRLVLTAPEDYPYAEERRLLYVAMTRTKTVCSSSRTVSVRPSSSKSLHRHSLCLSWQMATRRRSMSNARVVRRERCWSVRMMNQTGISLVAVIIPNAIIKCRIHPS